MKSSLKLLIAFTFLTYNVKAQNSTPPAISPLQQINSSEANMGNISSDIPMDYYTGRATITIPISTIKHNSISIPVSLSYTTSGIKVTQMASSVGLGWNLNGGGVITRTIRGREDNLDYNEADSISKQIKNSSFPHWSLQNILDDKLDSQPDLFSFSGPGFSGEFILNQNGGITLGEQNIGISYTTGTFTDPYKSGSFKIIKNFTITDSKGIKYLFDKYEYSYYDKFYGLKDAALGTYQKRNYDPLVYHVFESNNGTVPLDLDHHTKITSWFLSEITFPEDNSKIKYNYYGFGYQTYSDMEYFVWNAWVIGGCPPYNPEQPAPYNYEPSLPFIRRIFSLPNIVSQQLRSIEWPSGKINFDYKLRDDNFSFNNHSQVPYDNTRRKITPIKGGSGGALSEIKIYDNKKIFNNKFKLEHIYLGEGILAKDHLALKSITEFSSDGKELPPYIFKYNSLNAGLLSNKHDYWGYYRDHTKWNGGTPLYTDSALSKCPRIQKYPDNYSVTGIPQLTPAIQISLNVPLDVTYPNYANTIGSDRAWGLNQKDGEAGMLTTISFPSGKKVSFEYEPHVFFVPNGMTPNNGGVGIGGGLRVSKITSSYNTNQTTVDLIKYEGGYIFSMPQFTKSWSARFDQNRTGDSGSEAPYQVKVFGNPINDLETSHGSYVVYRDVMSTRVGQGSIKYQFSVPYSLSTRDDGDNGGFQYIYTNTLTSSLITTLDPSFKFRDLYPYPRNPNYDWARGQLISKKFYKDEIPNPVILLKKVENIYTTTPVDLEIYGTVSKMLNDERFDMCMAPNGNFSSDVTSFPSIYRYGIYTHTTGSKVLSKSTETLYPDGILTNLLSKETNITYAVIDGNRVIKSSEQIFPDGSAIKKVFKYKYHEWLVFFQNSGNPFIDALPNLKSNDIVEEITYFRSKISDPYRIIAGKLNTYRIFPNGPLTPQIDSIFILQMENPINESDFFPTTVDEALAFYAVKDSSYFLERIIDLYDRKGNILQSTDRLGVSTVFKYDTISNNLIATFTNAKETNSRVGADVGYTSFENHKINENGHETQKTDFWGYENPNLSFVEDAHSGKYSCKIPNSSGDSFGPGRIFFPSRQTGKYKVSAWVKTEASFPANSANSGATLVIATISANDPLVYSPSNGFNEIKFNDTGGEWKYIEKIIDLGQIKSDGGLPSTTPLRIQCYPWNRNSGKYFLIDDLTFQPVDSQSEKITYDSMRRITSKTDQTSTSINYIYDGFGNLLFVTDQNKNIISATNQNNRGE